LDEPDDITHLKKKQKVESRKQKYQAGIGLWMTGADIGSGERDYRIKDHKTTGLRDNKTNVENRNAEKPKR